MRTFTLGNGTVLEAWRAPLTRGSEDTAVRTPWGPMVATRPGSWVIWSPDSQTIICLVSTTRHLLQIGRLA